MFNIGEYLNKFKKISENRDFLRKAVSEAVKNICGIDIDPEDIDVRDGIARIRSKPIIKNEIFLKKNKIMDFLKNKTDKIADIL